MAKKLDLKKLWSADYAAPRKPSLLIIDKAAYLAIEGQGEPGGKEFSEKIAALYAMAYTIKMTRKYTGGQDYTVSKLEAQWWGDKGADTDFEHLPRSQWCWRLMIRTPEFVKEKELKDARCKLRDRGKELWSGEVHLYRVKEGKCVQMLHVGAYDEVGRTHEVMLAYAEASKLSFSGLHHEIYISDPHRVAPEKLKTILRQPVTSR